MWLAPVSTGESRFGEMGWSVKNFAAVPAPDQSRAEMTAYPIGVPKLYPTLDGNSGMFQRRQR